MTFIQTALIIFGFVQICSQPRDDTDEEDNELIVFSTLISNEESEERKTAYAQCIAHFKENELDWISWQPTRN